MSNKNNLRFLVALLLAAAACAALVVADVGALSQNANSSTTPDDSAQSTGDISGEQVDLSGTYSGRVTMTGGHDMSGQAELTITGNTFTLTGGEGMTHNGRVYAVVTRGYIGAAFYFPDITDPRTNTPVVANVRARKSGDRLTLSPVPNASTRMTFGAAASGGTRRPRRGRRAAPPADANANDNTGDNSNATPPR